MTIRSRLIVVVLALASSACVARSSGQPDPFAATPSRAASERPAVRVTLEVVCDACLISYSIGSTEASARQDRLNPVWITRLVRRPGSTEVIELTATSDGGSVHRVRIFVDGEVAAIDDNDAMGSRATLCATAVIPREPGSSAATQGGCRQRNGDVSEGR
jgi:hypothetical protein